MERLLAQVSALEGMLAIPLPDTAECTIGELDRRVRKIESRYNVISPDPADQPSERGLRYRLDALTARSTARKPNKELELIAWAGADAKEPDMEAVLRAWYTIDATRRIPATDEGRLRVASALAWQCGKRCVHPVMLDAYGHADLFSWATALQLFIENTKFRPPIGFGAPPPPPGVMGRPISCGPPPPMGPPPPFYSGPVRRRKAYSDDESTLSSGRSSSVFSVKLPWWKKLWRKITFSRPSRSRVVD